MVATADVVIIGGGVRGTVIAYYLAGAGVRVILVEKGGFASEASGSNIGLVNVSRKTPAHYAAFNLESANRYPKLVALADKLARARRLIPALAGVEMIRFWAGLRPMPADGKPMYDEAENVRGFYTAVGHSGITLAPITGQLFTEWLTTGKRRGLLDPYRLDRLRGAPPLHALPY